MEFIKYNCKVGKAILGIISANIRARSANGAFTAFTYAVRVYAQEDSSILALYLSS